MKGKVRSEDRQIDDELLDVIERLQAEELDGHSRLDPERVPLAARVEVCSGR